MLKILNISVKPPDILSNLMITNYISAELCCL